MHFVLFINPQIRQDLNLHCIFSEYYPHSSYSLLGLVLRLNLVNTSKDHSGSTIPLFLIHYWSLSYVITVNMHHSAYRGRCLDIDNIKSHRKPSRVWLTLSFVYPNWNEFHFPFTIVNICFWNEFDIMIFFIVLHQFMIFLESFTCFKSVNVPVHLISMALIR